MGVVVSEVLYMLFSLLSLLGDGFRLSFAGFPFTVATAAVAPSPTAPPTPGVGPAATGRWGSRAVIRAGLSGRGLLNRREGLVTLEEAELNTQLQDGLLLLMDGLVQMGVLILHTHTDTESQKSQKSQ